MTDADRYFTLIKPKMKKLFKFSQAKIHAQCPPTKYEMFKTVGPDTLITDGSYLMNGTLHINDLKLLVDRTIPTTTTDTVFLRITAHL